ncbi:MULTISPECIES: hypothetical protein [Streptomyces]|nr:hypothetical protein [Streptomyces hilarionis]MCQ9131907.1 hypothetical protein [Streptomyces hilarionis]
MRNLDRDPRRRRPELERAEGAPLAADAVTGGASTAVHVTAAVVEGRRL